MAPDVFTTQNTGQPIVFLFLGTELDNQRADHLHAHIAPAIHAPALLLFVKDKQLGRVQPHTAVFCWPGRCDPAFRVQLAMPMFDLGKFGTVRQITQLLGIFRFEKTAHFLAEIRIAHRVPIGHCAAPSSSRASNQSRL